MTSTAPLASRSAPDDDVSTDDLFDMWFAPPNGEHFLFPEKTREELIAETLCKIRREEKKEADELVAVASAKRRRTEDHLRGLYACELLDITHELAITTSSLLPLFEPDDARVIASVASLSATSESFYIGICAAPYNRYRAEGHGHYHSWRFMHLVLAGESSRVVAAEVAAIDRFLGTSGCMNKRRGGGGRSPPGTVSFMYVCTHALAQA